MDISLYLVRKQRILGTRSKTSFFSFYMALCIPIHLRQRTSRIYQDHLHLCWVLTSFVPPVHNQGVSLAPLQGHALWKIFLPTTGSFFVCFITDFLPSCNSTFSGRFPIAFRFLYFQLPWLVSAFKHSLLKCSNQPRYTAS